jgi:hypothetical protein
MNVDRKQFKHMSQSEVLATVMRHTVGNRNEIEASKTAGCVSCCVEFCAKEVQEWHDEWTTPERQNRVKRWTAKCPRCGEPTLVGSATGLLEDQAFLPVMNHFRAAEPKAKR